MTQPQTPLTATDSSGQDREFYYRVTEDTFEGRAVRNYHVALKDPDDPQDDYYTARFEEVEAGCWQVTALSNEGREDYCGKGITPAIFARCAAETSGRIQSSSNTSEHQVSKTESRSGDATRVWEGLVRRGTAYYEPSSDRYKLFASDLDHRITVHEAGHAVVAAVQGRLDAVWVRRDHRNLRGTNQIQGRVKWGVKDPSQSPTVDELWNCTVARVAVALAGPISEVQICGSAGDGYYQDYHRANALCAVWCLSSDEGEVIQDNVWHLVASLRPTIELLAKELASLLAGSIPPGDVSEMAAFLGESEDYARRGAQLDGRAIVALEAALGARGVSGPVSVMPERLRHAGLDLVGLRDKLDR